MLPPKHALQSDAFALNADVSDSRAGHDLPVADIKHGGLYGHATNPLLI